MFFLLESHFEVLCCCLHALQKSHGNFTKCRLCLPRGSHPQGFIPPSRRPCWCTSSPSFPLAYKVPTHSMATHFFHHSLSSHQEFRDCTRAFPSMRCLGLHTSVLSQILGFHSQPGRSQKMQHPAEAQCKISRWHTSTPVSSWSQHYSSRPVNTSCCTVPPTKLSGQVRGGLIK